MKFLKRNYGWMIVAILAMLPFLPLSNVFFTNFPNGIPANAMQDETAKDAIRMLYHISGEFAIRWMTAVLTLTPFFILFGVQNLFVRQVMGIATAVWSFVHFIIFICAAGFLETFTQYNYVAGFVAVLILIPLFFTSNRKSMKYLKTTWKKIQRFAYFAIFLSLLHVAILEKTWIFYAVIVGLGMLIRVPVVKQRFVAIRNR